MRHLEKHNADQMRAGEDGERMQGESMMAVLQFARLIARTLGQPKKEPSQAPDRVAVEMDTERQPIEEQAQQGVTVEMGEAQELQVDSSEIIQTQDISEEYRQALHETLDNTKERVVIGHEEYQIADHPRREELYAESQAMSDVVINFSDRSQEINKKQQQIQLLSHQNEALAQNPTTANKSMILENNQKIGGLQSEIDSGMAEVIRDAAAINEQLAKAPVGSLTPDDIAIVAGRSINNELASRIAHSNLAMTMAAALPDLSSGNLAIDGITVDATEMTKFGAERTVVHDDRDPENSKTYFIDNYSELGITQVSGESGELLMMKDGQINFLNLDSDSQSFIVAIEKGQTEADIGLMREAQAETEPDVGKASVEIEGDKRELVSAGKNREIEI